MLIEQFVHRALAMADDCVILIAKGEVSWKGRAEDAGPEVLDHYLGAASTA